MILACPNIIVKEPTSQVCDAVVIIILLDLLLRPSCHPIHFVILPFFVILSAHLSS
jgi:hypothetical protein